MQILQKILIFNDKKMCKIIAIKTEGKETYVKNVDTESQEKFLVKNHHYKS